MVNTFPRAAGLDLRCANRHCCWCCFTLERKHRTERKKIMPLFGVYACLLNVKFFLALAKAKSFIYISLISLCMTNTRFWRPRKSGAWGHVHPAAPLSLRLCSRHRGLWPLRAKKVHGSIKVGGFLRRWFLGNVREYIPETIIYLLYFI